MSSAVWEIINYYPPVFSAGGGFNPPTSPWAANSSFHISHLYSIYVSMVERLVLLNTHFVNVFSCPDQTIAKPHMQTPQNESCLPAGMSARCLCTAMQSRAGSVGEDHPGTAQKLIY